MVRLRYSFRSDPTPGQRIALARVVFNDAIALRRQADADGSPFISDGELSKRVITQAEQRPDRSAGRYFASFVVEVGVRPLPNRAKARAKLARRHAKVTDARREFHHQESTRMVRENQAIFVEDLSTHGEAAGRI